MNAERMYCIVVDKKALWRNKEEEKEIRVLHWEDVDFN